MPSPTGMEGLMPKAERLVLWKVAWKRGSDLLTGIRRSTWTHTGAKSEVRSVNWCLEGDERACF